MLRDRDTLVVRHITPPDAKEYPVPLRPGTPPLPIRLRLGRAVRLGETGPGILYVDKETLKGGLTLRKWRKGDYFYPLGMRGRKLVSKYFKDAGMNRFEREDQWLLCSGGAVVWIVGRRADDRFKVTGKTRKIVKIQWED